MKSTAAIAMAAFALLAQSPAFGADNTDCGALVQNVNAAADSIARNSTTYWAERNNFVASQSVGAKAPPAQGEQSKARALPIQAAMPSALANFATLVSKARSSDCMTEEQAAALKEKTFAHARRVNFDRFPLTPNTEGAPSSQNRPQPSGK